MNNTSNVSQGNNCSLNVFEECINSGLEWWNSGLGGLAVTYFPFLKLLKHTKRTAFSYLDVSILSLIALIKQAARIQ